MKITKCIYFGIILISFSFSQTLKISNGKIAKNSSSYINIFAYDIVDLQSIQIKLEYDKDVIIAKDIESDIYGNLLSSDYVYTTNITRPGEVEIAISLFDNDSEIFSGNSKIIKILFENTGIMGITSIHFIDAQINSIPVLDSAESGTIDVVLSELQITASDELEIGSDDFIVLGMCKDCTDGFKYAEDEYDNPNPQGEYTNIHFYQPDWIGKIDINGNTCTQSKFASDFRNTHYYSELIIWGITGYTGGGLDSDIPIILSWDAAELISSSNNFKIFMYIGDQDGINMQETNSITINQDQLALTNNGEPNIFVIIGACSDSGTSTYYYDSDGDGLGSSEIEQQAQYCSSYVPDNWVQNNIDLDDNIYCISNQVDCLNVLCGQSIIDECGICNGENDCLDCIGIPNGNSQLDCNGDCNGSAFIDNCFNCVNGNTGNFECEMDCNGQWGGNSIKDECEICNGEQFDGDIDNDGEICESECLNFLDCNGECSGSATIDECGVCDNDSSNDCIQDCLGFWGGNATIDECGVCDNDSSNDCIQDCLGFWGGNATIDECGVCDNDLNNDCAQDCLGIWGGNATTDECGVCDNDSSNDCIKDCTGIWGGNAYLDNCDICVDGNTGIESCIQDCAGIWGGYAQLDECGVCSGGTTQHIFNSDMDCIGECFGLSKLDECGVCNGNGVFDWACDCSGNQLDCLGVCGGSALIDECGVCNGNGKSFSCCNEELVCNPQDCEFKLDNCEVCDNDPSNDCTIDCLGIMDGPNKLDNCEVCDNDPSNDCIQDCAGIWGGNAYLDNCDICVGGNTGVESCIQDCAGIWGGTFWMSDCGCVSSNNSGEDCYDCFDVPNGNGVLDICGICNGIGLNEFGCCIDEEPDCDGLCGGLNIPSFNCIDGNIVCYISECTQLDFNASILPETFNINKIYPNPFNPKTTIQYQISESSNISLSVYNINGQKVEDLIKNYYVFPGNYLYTWNGSDQPSGIYFVILFSGSTISKQKMILLK